MSPENSASSNRIRNASLGDLPAIVAMLTAYREKLATWAPQFWRPAIGASAMSSLHLGSLIGQNGHIFLVSERGDKITGFALALETPAPPVYAPGKTGTLDDFCVAEGESWADTGAKLVEAIRRAAKDAGWQQLIVVSPQADEAKNAVLQKAGLAVASQWWTTSL